MYFIFRSVQIETILFPNDKLINFLQSNQGEIERQILKKYEFQRFFDVV